MRLYLVQHGMAVDESVDPERPLSDEGRAEVERMAQFLARAKIELARVWHSGKLRAEQTGQILAGSISPPPQVEMHDGLKPKDDPDKVAKCLKKRDENLLIAGHLPSLSKLASLLLTGKEGTDIVRFRYAGIVCLERDESKNWQLVWMVTPDVL